MLKLAELFHSVIQTSYMKTVRKVEEHSEQMSSDFRVSKTSKNTSNQVNGKGIREFTGWNGVAV